MGAALADLSSEWNWIAGAGALVMVTAIAAGASDTVASEIGKAWGGQPRSFPTFRAAPPGTPGAVSVVGTIAGIAAAALIAALAACTGAAAARDGADCGDRVHRRRVSGKRARDAISNRPDSRQQHAELPEHGRRGRPRRLVAIPRVVPLMRRFTVYLELARPFTLVAPALGFFSGGLTAIGAAPREPWSPAPARSIPRSAR